MSRPEETSPYRLTVEGSDDKHSIIHLLKRNGYDWDRDDRVRPHVHEAGSWERTLASVGIAAKTYQRAGIVVDADDDPKTRWQAIRDRLQKAGYTPPQNLAVDGVVLDHPGLARFGVWLMPNNELSGRLEDFLNELVPTDDPVWSHAQAATTSALSLGAKLRPTDHVKGSLHAWLAWRDPPGMAFGTAITALAFTHDSALALRFVAWFRSLFEG